MDWYLVSKQNSTHTISLRISEEILSEIEKEAKTNLTSTNTLINKILYNYVNWDRYSKKMKMYPISVLILRAMLTKSNVVENGELVDLVLDSIRECALLIHKKNNFESCLQVTRDYCNMFEIPFEYSSSDDTNTISIRHNFGKNFSLLFEKVFERILWDFEKDKIVDCQSTKSCVVITTKKKTLTSFFYFIYYEGFLILSLLSLAYLT